MTTLKPVARKKPVTELKDAHVRRVLDTTKRLMASEGIEKITIRGLAAASGVAPATLYNRFIDKETLISIVVVDHYEREVRQGFLDGIAAGSPMEGFVGGLKRLAQTCQENRAFVRAVVGMYYSIGGKRDMPKVMYRTLHETLSALLVRMRDQGALRDWVPVDASCSEICERCFSVIHRWVIGEIPERALLDQLMFGTLSILLGVSTAGQAREIEEILRRVTSKPGFESRARLAIR